MRLFVLKNPSAEVVSEAVHIDDGAEVPSAPWEEMTPEAYASWKAAQPRPLRTLRAEKLASLEADESAAQGGITVGDVTLAATDSSLLKIIGLMVFMDRATSAGMLAPADNVTVHDINDVPVVLTVTQMNSLLLGFGAQYIAGFSSRKAKFNAIRAATTVEAIEAIN